jgi:hypothetical protein
MLTAVTDAAAAGEETIAAAGHGDLRLAPAVSIIGAVFALQGFGVIEGSAMSNNHIFEVVGPLAALAGLVLAALGLRHRRSASQ